MKVIAVYGGAKHVVMMENEATGEDLFLAIRAALSAPDLMCKVVFKGKQILAADSLRERQVKEGSKLLVIASSSAEVDKMKDKRPDPLVKGFEQEEKELAALQKANRVAAGTLWGEEAMDKTYCIARFGSLQRFEGQNPHPFAAKQLLRSLACDPGVVAVMREYELVVILLEEMDPDDRLAAKTASERGGCLLGYNMNHGQAIYLRLRADTNQFRPYHELIDTLLHELTHNLVGPHDIFFWRAFSQIKASYLRAHLDRRRFPMRFPKLSASAPSAEQAKDEADCHHCVCRKLTHEAQTNAALQPGERQAAAMAGQEAGLRAQADAAVRAQQRREQGPVRTQAQGSELRSRMAEAAMARLDVKGSADLSKRPDSTRKNDHDR